MIASLSGRVGVIGAGHVEIDVGGVGYRVLVPSSLVASLEVGESARLLTHLVVREDSMTLYGFATQDQRDTFLALINVNGVGPKLAMSAISVLGPDGIRRAVLIQDADLLTQVPGVGKRSAQRMLLELKERLDVTAEAFPATSKLSEVREALMGLGYSANELHDVLANIASAPDEVAVEDLLKGALKELSRV